MLHLLNNLNLSSLHLAPISLSFGVARSLLSNNKNTAHTFLFH